SLKRPLTYRAASQVRNTEAERRASEVRLRAERKAGELLKALARADAPNPGGRNQHEVTSNDRTQPTSPYNQALESTGLTCQTAHRYQALANVPEKELRDTKHKRVAVSCQCPPATGITLCESSTRSSCM